MKKTATTTKPAQPDPTVPQVRCAHTRLVNPAELKPHPKNPNTHPPEQVRLLAKIIASTGFRNAIVVSTRSGFITKGHGRLDAALLNHYTLVPVDFQDYDTDEQEIADILADNLVSDLAVMNRSAMRGLLKELEDKNHDPELAGFLQAQTDQANEKKKLAGNLSRKFIVPPFTVLDTRTGPWIARRQLWEALGINSSQGRDEKLTYAASSQSASVYSAKNAYEAQVGRKVTWEEFIENNPDVKLSKTTSSFNPAMCEVIFHWFCPPNAAILDPFAGGCAAGIVAAVLGHRFTGIELRAEQIAENYRQAAQFFNDTGINPAHQPKWIHGSSLDMETLLPPDAKFDLVLSSPPYHDLEKYSDQEGDLSNQTEPQFREMLKTVVELATARLLQNRFSAWVVGDYRPAPNVLRFMATDIIRASPAPLYNHATYITPATSLAVRVSRSFSALRKLGKNNQDIVFCYKGDQIELENRADAAAIEHITFCYNGEVKTIPEALGSMGARDIVPLGDILSELTQQRDSETTE